LLLDQRRFQDAVEKFEVAIDLEKKNANDGKKMYVELSATHSFILMKTIQVPNPTFYLT